MKKFFNIFSSKLFERFKLIKLLIIFSILNFDSINELIGVPNLLSIFDPNDIHKPFLILRFDNSIINFNFIG